MMRQEEKSADEKIFEERRAKCRRLRELLNEERKRIIETGTYAGIKLEEETIELIKQTKLTETRMHDYIGEEAGEARRRILLEETRELRKANHRLAALMTSVMNMSFEFQNMMMSGEDRDQFYGPEGLMSYKNI